ncbi:hypothetical protein CLAFUW4_10416 [Fulvia fulva]|uniref:Uncharacterized protein n=1 Tax=Passalora fulva TaxID=5499 RepID=A0A9Q8LFJ5_PASFU|nr:uncharacterized protein CLAFUR5_05031 [Fulvia fulva]KAK4615591.1 hypothetical protein CLAFUR4_10420 [Fulvia fulva]KAK4616852.1 hypothetical protein CLAFUR0_10421 [Fulvia fulva]UJO16522.1 hypothetical protein CLAFUR5_05031 [Fulvia fulva]WPV19508.1 hypothetical protein CLAFUW4_10416 [Fulvia fulva]WPV34717.1 hypothetical protein CLAFUW7_10416 [Fulvia fulva]
MFTTKTILALSAVAITTFAAPAPVLTTQTITATHDFGAGPTAFSWTTIFTVTPAGGVAPTPILAKQTVGEPVKPEETTVVGAPVKVEPTPIVVPSPSKPTEHLTTQTITATADFGAGRVPFTWTTTFPVAPTPLHVA